MNSSYEVFRELSAVGDHLDGDLHEFRLTERDRPHDDLRENTRRPVLIGGSCFGLDLRRHCPRDRYRYRSATPFFQSVTRAEPVILPLTSFTSIASTKTIKVTITYRSTVPIQSLISILLGTFFGLLADVVMISPTFPPAQQPISPSNTTHASTLTTRLRSSIILRMITTFGRRNTVVGW